MKEGGGPKFGGGPNPGGGSPIPGGGIIGLNCPIIIKIIKLKYFQVNRKMS